MHWASMTDLGCVDYWTNVHGNDEEGVNNAVKLNAYFQRCYDNKGPSFQSDTMGLHLEGKQWAIDETIMIPAIMSFIIEGGGGWLARNYSITHYGTRPPNTNSSGVSNAQIVWNPEGDPPVADRVMIDFVGHGLEFRNITLAGAPVTDHNNWDGPPLPEQAHIGFQTSRRTGGVGTGKITFQNLCCRQMDIGVSMGNPAVSLNNCDNTRFSGITTFANCTEAGFRSMTNNAVQFMFEYMRNLGASSGIAFQCVDGGNYQVDRCEIIDGGHLLQVRTTSNKNSCTFVMNNLKWDTTTFPTPTGPYLVQCWNNQSAGNYIFRNAHLPWSTHYPDNPEIGPDDHPQLFRLRGGVRLLLDGCHNIRNGVVHARSVGPNFAHSQTPVVITQNCTWAGSDSPYNGSIFWPEAEVGPDAGGVHIWKNATVHGLGDQDPLGTGADVLYQDGEEFYANARITRRSGHHIQRLEEGDPQVEGAWFVDSNRYVRMSNGPGQEASFVRQSVGAFVEEDSAVDVNDARTWRVLPSSSGFRAPQVVEVGVLGLPVTLKFDVEEILNPDTIISTITQVTDSEGTLTIENIRLRSNQTDILFDITAGFVSDKQHTMGATFSTNDGQTLSVSGTLQVI